MSLLDIKQLVGFAIRIEENGEAFYRKWAEKTGDAEVKQLFVRLANEELGHRRIFQELESTLDEPQVDVESVESYDMYSGYLKTYADNVLFSEGYQAAGMEKVNGIGAAFDFAIQRELDSLLFYLELKSFVSGENERVLEKIVNEERRHYLDLVLRKKSLS